jgi:1,4-dihydroxy-2-naphthoyl-CoA synthase
MAQTEGDLVVGFCSEIMTIVPGAIGKTVPGHVVEIIDEEGKIAKQDEIGFPETDVGLTITTAGTKLLAQIVGLGNVKELVFTGDVVDAQEALSIGLANKVVAAESLLDESMAMARRIGKKYPLALNLNSPGSPSTRDCSRASSKHWNWKPAIF